MNARIGVVLALLGLLACSSNQGPRSLDTAPKAKRFVVLPINALVPIPPELSGAKDRVLGQIARYLKVQGCERWTMELPETQELWFETVSEVSEDASLPNDFSTAIKFFIPRLGQKTDFDAVVVGSLVYRGAKLVRRTAKWDGVVRRITEIGEENLVPESLRTTITAVSLHIMVFDTGGELIFSNYGGLDLVHAITLTPGSDGVVGAVLRDEILEERHRLREGVEVAFEPYFDRPPSGDW